MSLPPSIREFEGQLVCFEPWRGWGWYRLGVSEEDRFLDYALIDAAGVFHMGNQLRRERIEAMEVLDRSLAAYAPAPTELPAATNPAVLSSPAVMPVGMATELPTVPVAVSQAPLQSTTRSEVSPELAEHSWQFV